MQLVPLQRGGRLRARLPTKEGTYLDDERYLECVYYLEAYAPRLLAHFMFRHGRAAEACTAGLCTLNQVDP
jgi:hypothetical protein